VLAGCREENNYEKAGYFAVLVLFISTILTEYAAGKLTADVP